MSDKAISLNQKRTIETDSNTTTVSTDKLAELIRIAEEGAILAEDSSGPGWLALCALRDKLKALCGDLQ